MSLRPEDVTFALAVEDAVPVLLAGAATWWLTRSSLLRTLGLVGAVLVVTGGLAKVGWKLGAAGWGTDLTGLDAALFPLLGAGFACVVAALVWRRWLALAGPVAGALALALQDTWPCLVLTIVGSTATLVLGVVRSRGDHLAAALFAVALLSAYGLVPLAARQSQTLALQWTEQSVNTLGQAAFALAAWRLRPTISLRSTS